VRGRGTRLTRAALCLVQVLDEALAIFAEQGGARNAAALQRAGLLHVALVQLDCAGFALRQRVLKVPPRAPRCAPPGHRAG